MAIGAGATADRITMAAAFRKEICTVDALVGVRYLPKTSTVIFHPAETVPSSHAGCSAELHPYGRVPLALMGFSEPADDPFHRHELLS